MDSTKLSINKLSFNKYFFTCKDSCNCVPIYFNLLHWHTPMINLENDKFYKSKDNIITIIKDALREFPHTKYKRCSYIVKWGHPLIMLQIKCFQTFKTNNNIIFKIL
jgi:cysteinyl-tRNA synthetase